MFLTGHLAQSIALRGLLVPLIVRPVEDAYELIAGYHRIAPCRKLALPDAPVVVREHESSSADRAAEHVTRKQLTLLEEAESVQAMFDEGYTADGAAQALGWNRAKVTARAKILTLRGRTEARRHRGRPGTCEVAVTPGPGWGVPARWLGSGRGLPWAAQEP